MTVRRISQNINKIKFKSPIHKVAKAVAKDLKHLNAWPWETGISPKSH